MNGTAAITCYPGYNRTGSGNISCQADGTWSNSTACEKICKLKLQMQYFMNEVYTVPIARDLLIKMCWERDPVNILNDVILDMSSFLMGSSGEPAHL